MRKPIVAGNWKMNKSVSEAVELAEEIIKRMPDLQRKVEVVLCPPFTALKSVGDVISSSTIQLSAQNMHWERSGAYTGEVSASMLRDIFCHFVILGHSERRAYFGETSEIVNRKARAALDSSLSPIVCVGETLEERESDRTFDVVGGQVRQSLADIGDAMKKVIVAYEPVWAIGTGRTATPKQAQEVHAFIRSELAAMTSDSVAKSVRLQYGGSVKGDNAAELFSQPDIDGGLVGGASLEARSFIDIVQAACGN